jgi:hypothetical protein
LEALHSYLFSAAHTGIVKPKTRMIWSPEHYACIIQIHGFLRHPVAVSSYLDCGRPFMGTGYQSLFLTPSD